MARYRALAVYQPYAQWIADGHKTVEVRSWQSLVRGEIAICATTRNPHQSPHPTGVVAAIVNLHQIDPFEVDDERAAMVPWRPNHYAWRLRDARPLKPIPVRCGMKWFWVDI